MPTISISTREDENNRSMIQPPARTESGLTLRPISLGSLEVLRQLGNPLSAGNAELTKSQNTIWVSLKTRQIGACPPIPKASALVFTLRAARFFTAGISPLFTRPKAVFIILCEHSEPSIEPAHAGDST